jgi:ubiquinone/menaquinone biosynthesis C-methylase UbiE
MRGSGRRRRTVSLSQRAMESEAIARVYESRLWRRSLPARLALGLSFEREQRLVLEAAELGSSARVLDLACGSGIYTRPLARALGARSVVGIDLSRPMLRNAQRLAARERLIGLQLVHGDALALPFRDARFDLVNCCGALHLFPDPARALAEMGRVLRPGGRCTVAVVRRPGGLLAPVAAALAQLGVASFTAGSLDELLRAAGLAGTRVLHERALWIVASAWRAPG